VLHFRAQNPPQSVAVSFPFLTLSKQEGAAQVEVAPLLVHTKEAQSRPSTQFLVAGHPGQFGPPQSRSVSC